MELADTSHHEQTMVKKVPANAKILRNLSNLHIILSLPCVGFCMKVSDQQTMSSALQQFNETYNNCYKFIRTVACPILPRLPNHRWQKVPQIKVYNVYSFDYSLLQDVVRVQFRVAFCNVILFHRLLVGGIVCHRSLFLHLFSWNVIHWRTGDEAVNSKVVPFHTLLWAREVRQKFVVRPKFPE